MAEPAEPAQPHPVQPQPVQPQPAQPQPAQPPPAYGYGYGYQQPYAPPPPPAPEPPPTRHVSITASPVHLVLPMFEPMVEVRVVDGFGIGVIGGIGSVTAEDAFGEEHRFDAYEFGGQLAFYPLEAFDSLVFGVEVLYLKVETDDDTEAELSGVADGVALGPFIGYKLITSVGFTFLVHGGVEYVAYRAEASDAGGTLNSEEESRWIPLINLNLGWSI